MDVFSLAFLGPIGLVLAILLLVGLRKMVIYFSSAARMERLASGRYDELLPPPVVQLTHDVEEHVVLKDAALVNKLKGHVEFVGYIPRADTVGLGSKEYDIEEIYVVDVTGRIHTLTRRRCEVGGAFGNTHTEAEARWLAERLGVKLETA